MRISNKIIGVVCLFLLSIACKKQEKYVEKTTPDWKVVQDFYLENIVKSISDLDELKEEGVKGKKAKTIFKNARASFKKAEPYAAYLNPSVGHRANGPALPVYKEDNGKILKPVGFQKIEESIYEGEVSNVDFIREVDITKGLLLNLKKNIEKRALNPQRFFIATHQQLFRIISLAISGFDTPVSHLGIEETTISLESLRFVYQESIQFLIQKKNPELDKEFISNIDKSIRFIDKNTDFETFDRYTFIRDYINPITRNWVKIRQESALWDGVDTHPFNFDAPTFFEKNSFNLTYFTPAVNRNPTDKQILLGQKLFFDPNLSKKGKMSCATCHIPEKAYADGMVTNFSNTGEPLLRNTPTLINTAFQQSFFWDGRSETLLDQISSVFINDQEFDSTVHQFSDAILKDTTYIKLFKEAYGGISTKNIEVIKAISSYISTLNGFDSKFDKNIRGEESTFTDEEKLGFNLFMGKALCATCHFVPLTNGTVPPFFTETEKEVIGVPETAKNKMIDNDLGFYWKFEEELHRGMFKTPTIRNADLTAPYMHNGVYNTLEEVMEFYNLGGGGGMGFDLPHQTLPFDELNLTDKELKAIIAYVKTLTDENVTTNYN
ncbi:cytochrome c peroxidase [Aquimarina sp. MAR_2010_214]|uniref:cytochrome c peroxidase n=1 Tax=Aquimarina sp. MAR_2010_214 TaxID=1250026 RepID=UPI000C70EF60|nr:cytochrome c peroxidase [Aquimarina sp. MAR_2010_214]PKV51504.1 cytochrome c peroxidase [Aquimarina sp. MAR_2010_214]